MPNWGVDTLHSQRVPSSDIQASVDDILEKLSIAEKTELNLKLFSQLPNNIKEEVLAQHLATVPITHISSIVGRMPVEVRQLDIFFFNYHYDFFSLPIG